MTDTSDLVERLRETLPGVEPDDFRGDNLAIFLASELEPTIDDETLDDSGTWKQGAIDACDRVLDAIHAHYATALETLASRAETAERRVAELEAQLPEGMKHCTITFHECEIGHGRLSATNWIDNGCHWCTVAALQRERDEARAALSDIHDMTTDTRLVNRLMEIEKVAARAVIKQGE